MEPVRIVSVILHRDGQFLLQHRDNKPGIGSPGMWCCFGGHCDPGEDEETAARREIEEETGYHIEGDLELMSQERMDGREFTFYAAPLFLPPEELTLGEGQAMRLVAPEEFDRLPLVESHRLELKRFVARRA